METLDELCPHFGNNATIISFKSEGSSRRGPREPKGEPRKQREPRIQIIESKCGSQARGRNGSTGKQTVRGCLL